MRLIALFLALPYFLIAQGDYTKKRTALVIGNSNYTTAPLKNPKNDAIAMAKTLEQLGFEVLSYIDISRSEMRQAIQDFGELLEKKNGVGLFYYAGHGLQYQGKNYLVPVNAKIEKAYQIEDECVRADQVLRMMELYKNPVNIVVLDACRNNPYVRSFRDLNQGLVKPDKAPVGSYIAFATSPGSVASDGDGENGLYTQELIEAIKKPGLSIENVFKQVRKGVIEASNEAQIPWESSSLTGNFYFIEPEIEINIESLFVPLINCGSEINVQIPLLGDNYNPSFRIKGGIIIEGGRPGLITLIPTETIVELTILNNNEIVDIKKFYAAPVSPPQIQIRADGIPIDLRRGLVQPGPDTISVHAIANVLFQKMYPKDARYYKITKWEFLISRGTRPLMRRTITDTQGFHLAKFHNIVKPADYFHIRILEAKRKNYLNNWVEVVGLENIVFTVLVRN